MITDFSSPKGYSINDFIPNEEAIVHYENFNRAVDIVSELGRGTLLAKLDVKSAFRMCPVAPSDWHLLGLFPLWVDYFNSCADEASCAHKIQRLKNSFSSFGHPTSP